MAKNKIYPFAVASVRSMENSLLTKQKLMQIAEAKDMEEAIRMLGDTAYGKTQIRDVHLYEQMIANHLEETYVAVAGLIPTETFVDIFLYKNDYHNIKVLLKEEVSKVNGRPFLVRGGTIPVDKMAKNLRERNYVELPNIDGDAVELAVATYAKTQNARYIDTILDKACFATMAKAADKLGNDYVSKYVKTLMDITNLKSLLRIKKLEREGEELEECYILGGNLSLDLLLRAFRSESFIQVLKETQYGTLCEEYMGQGFTVFEKACDDYLMSYVKEAKYKTLTPEPVMAFILAKETEAKCVRIILACKLHDIDVEIIKERVRESYV
ncbi:V-type ATP synthase subunit C [Chakrabartyella piscis]|uniref:V-type ATP synthase subunit C n=1 Tax=Chakrabartyella piscis TaxID=2918914 RepID=UPI0029588515|nr:V-type ATP synthase subunit C [Chakrabartyella piscis]